MWPWRLNPDTKCMKHGTESSLARNLGEDQAISQLQPGPSLLRLCVTSHHSGADAPRFICASWKQQAASVPPALGRSCSLPADGATKQRVCVRGFLSGGFLYSRQEPRTPRCPSEFPSFLLFEESLPFLLVLNIAPMIYTLICPVFLYFPICLQTSVTYTVRAFRKKKPEIHILQF